MRPVGSKWLCIQDKHGVKNGEIFQVVAHDGLSHECKLLNDLEDDDDLVRLSLTDPEIWLEYHDKSTKFKEIYDILNSD